MKNHAKDYDEWIDAFLARHGDPVGWCAEATLEMQAAFPELARVRGHVLVAGGHQRTHWWLTTPDGEIVDPTASQFSAIWSYEPWTEGEQEPTGKCPNCGGYCYDGGTVCGDTCAREYAAYVMSARSRA